MPGADWPRRRSTRFLPAGAAAGAAGSRSFSSATPGGTGRPKGQNAVAMGIGCRRGNMAAPAEPR